MGRLAPAGPVYQAGTLSGNPLACAAGLATLRLADDAVYRRLDDLAAVVGKLASDALSAAGVPHRLSYAGNMFSIFFTATDVVDYDDGAHAGRGGVPGVLPRDAGARGLPAAQRVRGMVRVGGAGRRRRGADRRGACRPPRGPPLPEEQHERGRPWCTCCGTARCTTRRRSCTAGCPASASPSWAPRWPRPPPRRSPTATSSHVVASPLERAQETAEPIAAQFKLPVAADERLLESTNWFEGKRFSVGDGALRDPRNWWVLRDPVTPSWGEPYKLIGERMFAALHAARAAAEGHEAVCVSHQLPIWTLRRFVERKRLWHDPRTPAVRAGQSDLVPLRG